LSGTPVFFQKTGVLAIATGVQYPGFVNEGNSLLGDFQIEYLAGSKDVIFGPGSVIRVNNSMQQQVADERTCLLDFKRTQDIYPGSGSLSTRPQNRRRQRRKKPRIQLFTIQEIL
jgi:hypothetical protein